MRGRRQHGARGVSAVAACLLVCLAGRAEIIDRIVAIVAEHEITASDVDRQLRLEALFGDRPVEDSSAGRQGALERLIDQTLIAEDVRLSGLPPLTAQERRSALTDLRQQGFGPRAYEEGLRAFGLETGQVADFLAAQIQFTRYLTFRFRTGQVVSEQQVEAAYRARFGDSQEAPPLGDVFEQIRDEALADKATRLLEERIRQMRAETRIDRLEPIERGGGTTP